MITEDIHRNLSLIPLSSPSLAPTPDWHDSWTLTFDFQTAPMALLALTRKYHWAICSQSVWTKYCVIWVNKGERKTKHQRNGAPWRWVINLTVKGQTTTVLHSRQAFSFASSKKCQGRVSNNCCNPGDGKRRGRKLTVQGYIWPFWSWRLHLTLISFCYWWPSIHTQSLLATLQVSVSQ